ncbi:hypothetical protein PR048_022699 [Dryococelus australis]|uniref:Uncharacterized protein n=1 Tax=Dryococelus australis TaxID=614101 RepID=A0ABQ9GRY4_9NEOP|nr:hypothetical protein PR048_022699 [Dryococelus australis]
MPDYKLRLFEPPTQNPGDNTQRDRSFSWDNLWFWGTPYTQKAPAMNSTSELLHNCTPAAEAQPKTPQDQTVKRRPSIQDKSREYRHRTRVAVSLGHSSSKASGFNASDPGPCVSSTAETTELIHHRRRHHHNLSQSSGLLCVLFQPLVGGQLARSEWAYEKYNDAWLQSSRITRICYKMQVTWKHFYLSNAADVQVSARTSLGVLSCTPWNVLTSSLTTTPPRSRSYQQYAALDGCCFGLGRCVRTSNQVRLTSIARCLGGENITIPGYALIYECGTVVNSSWSQMRRVPSAPELMLQERLACSRKGRQLPDVVLALVGLPEALAQQVLKCTDEERAVGVWLGVAERRARVERQLPPLSALAGDDDDLHLGQRQQVAQPLGGALCHLLLALQVEAIMHLRTVSPLSSPAHQFIYKCQCYLDAEFLQVASEDGHEVHEEVAVECVEQQDFHRALVAGRLCRQAHMTRTAVRHTHRETCTCVNPTTKHSLLGRSTNLGSHGPLQELPVLRLLLVAAATTFQRLQHLLQSPATRSFSSTSRQQPYLTLSLQIFLGRQPPLLAEGATMAELLACSPATKVIRVQNPAGSLRTMQLVGGFSRGSPISPTLHSGIAPCSPQSPSSALKTSLLRAAQISSLTCW